MTEVSHQEPQSEAAKATQKNLRRMAQLEVLRERITSGKNPDGSLIKPAKLAELTRTAANIAVVLAERGVTPTQFDNTRMLLGLSLRRHLN